jgi:hypothetical protein
MLYSTFIKKIFFTVVSPHTLYNLCCQTLPNWEILNTWLIGNPDIFIIYKYMYMYDQLSIFMAMKSLFSAWIIIQRHMLYIHHRMIICQQYPVYFQTVIHLSYFNLLKIQWSCKLFVSPIKLTHVKIGFLFYLIN